MNMYGKVEGNRVVEFEGNVLKFDGKAYYNPSLDIIKKAGYKPVTESGMQFNRDDYCDLNKKITETEDEILVEYKYTFNTEKGRDVLNRMLDERTTWLLSDNVVESFLGFNVNARMSDLAAINEMLSCMDSKERIRFRDYENEFQLLTKTNLKKVKKEIWQSITELKNWKWALCDEIAQVNTLEDFDNVKEKIYD